jgi:hypothetical protein
MEGTSTVENVVQQMIGDMEEMRQQMDEIRKAVATLTTLRTLPPEKNPTVQQQPTVRQQPAVLLPQQQLTTGGDNTQATFGLGVPMQNPLYVPIPEVPEGSRVEIGDDRQKSKKEAEDRKVASQLESLEEKMRIMQGVPLLNQLRECSKQGKRLKAAERGRPYFRVLTLKRKQKRQQYTSLSDLEELTGKTSGDGSLGLGVLKEMGIGKEQW